jgi:hypothetical protein
MATPSGFVARNTRALASTVIVGHTCEAQISLALHPFARPDGTLSVVSARALATTTIAGRDEIARGSIVEPSLNGSRRTGFERSTSRAANRSRRSSWPARMSLTPAALTDFCRGPTCRERSGS